MTKTSDRGTGTSRSACFAILTLLILQPAAAEDAASARAQELINSMSRAVRERNYDGTFIYLRHRQMDSMRLIHKADQGGEFERLVSLTGMPREVIRDDRSVRCIYPDDEAVVVEKSRPRKYVAQLPEPVERIAPYYLFTLDGEDRVAGRDAWVVNIQPRDAFRYGYRLWIDKDSMLLLKSELRDKSGFPLEQIMFTELRVLDAVPDELLQPGVSGQNYTWYHGASSTKRGEGIREGRWTVSWMPNGFSMNEHEREALVASGKPVDHMVFSDGLASVSVFIEQLDGEVEMPVGLSRMGGVNTYAKHLGDFQVTAVGEVPPATVQRIANSVADAR
ncbi:MAG TPA: MucB/RseB C-terminal domain-containing protein [Gammaproteobacteria bacterium]|jgi:sigma-E factor negative regulatory protein RseB